MNPDIETKLSAARTRLILDKPFLGALVLRLPMVVADPNWCTTTATDARCFFYNADYIDSLSLDQTQFVLAHEALHCALSHFARRHHRDKHRWDLSCDFAINPLLRAEGLIPCPDALYLDAFVDMTAEEIYPCLDENEDMNTHDDHVYDKEEQSEGGSHGGGGNNDSEQQNGGGSQGESEQREGQSGSQSEPQQSDPTDSGADRPPPLTPQEQEQLSVQWSQRMAGAAQQAMQAGKMGGALARMIEHLLQPQLPWRMLLAQYMTVTARDDYNWNRPSRREGDAILPSLRSNELNVVVGIDTSGSVTAEELRQFLSEINAIKGQAHARITLLACDAALAEDGPWLYEPWDEFTLPREFKGGGGTDFQPVFDWVEQANRTPDLLVYFTDAQGRFPEQEPNLPVIWLVKGKAKVPWGQRIQLN